MIDNRKSKLLCSSNKAWTKKVEVRNHQTSVQFETRRKRNADNMS